MSSELSQGIVAQRIRNRRIEWLEIVAVDDDDPWAFGLGGLVDLWFDWNPDAPAVADYPPPIYTPGEAEALVAVGHAVNALCEATPSSIRDDAAVRAMLEWARVKAATRRALAEMAARGRLPED